MRFSVDHRCLSPLLIFLLISVPLSPSLVCAQQDGAEEGDDAWFDALEDPAEAIDDFYPELVLIDSEVDLTVHHFENRVELDERTVAEGWARIWQCHHNLDPVPDLQILYHAGRIRAIEVTRSERIGRAWVEGHSVQLQEIARGAQLCLTAESLVLRRENEQLVLRNGPFMRRFLDGYYPIRVSQRVSYPPELLRWEGITPADQPGFEVIADPGEIRFDTYFKGVLRTAIYFREQRRNPDEAEAAADEGDF